ncbi:phosphoribosylglycinamide formyltransferase [Chloroflexota bacterium]
MYRIGWFSTGRDKTARDLLLTVSRSISRGEFKAEIDFVFSNREPGEAVESDLFFDLVQGYRLPLFCSSSRRFQTSAGDYLSPQWRLEYDRDVIKHLDGRAVDICVLAGYMPIVGLELCRMYTMINLHPAAPGGPVGSWQEVIWKLIESEASETGVMMHLVTPEFDKGPSVSYCKFSIRGDPFDRYWDEVKGLSIEEMKATEGGNNILFKLIRSEGLKREFPLIVATLKAFSEGKIKIEDGKVLSADGEVINGYDLTSEIDDKVRSSW